MVELTQEYVRSLFDYRDGELYWKVSGKGRIIGTPAGSLGPNGYLLIKIRSKRYLNHRVIFLWHHRHLPEFLDHIDGDRLNNDISNLREATRQENSRNQKKPKSYGGKQTTSIYKGVSWNKPIKKWISYIWIDGKNKHLGCFDSEIEAAKSYDHAAVESFGEFARVNIW